MVLGEGDFDGNVLALADQLRRRPFLAREVQVRLVVEAMSRKWRVVQDMLDVSDEVPVTAWIVRRKAEVLLPRSESSEEPVADADPLSPDATWLPEARAFLTALLDRAASIHPREQGEPLSSRAPVKDASPWTLAWAYPKIPQRSAPRSQTVALDPDPIEHHIARIRSILREREWVRFRELTGGQNRRKTVVTFLAMVHLWHHREIYAEQQESYEELHLRRTEGGPT